MARRSNRPPPPPGKVYPTPQGRRNGWLWWPARYSWDEIVIIQLSKRSHTDLFNDDIERGMLYAEFVA